MRGKSVFTIKGHLLYTVSFQLYSLLFLFSSRQWTSCLSQPFHPCHVARNSAELTDKCLWINYEAVYRGATCWLFRESGHFRHLWPPSLQTDPPTTHHYPPLRTAVTLQYPTLEFPYILYKTNVPKYITSLSLTAPLETVNYSRFGILGDRLWKWMFHKEAKGNFWTQNFPSRLKPGVRIFR